MMVVFLRSEIGLFLKEILLCKFNCLTGLKHVPRAKCLPIFNLIGIWIKSESDNLVAVISRKRWQDQITGRGLLI